MSDKSIFGNNLFNLGQNKSTNSFNNNRMIKGNLFGNNDNKKQNNIFNII